MDKEKFTRIVTEGISPDWSQLLLNPALSKILDTLILEEKILAPPPKYILEFARITPLKEVSVVIIGQDPYPTPGHAHGLSFSCKVGVPKSLANIYKCLIKNGFIKASPMHGDLTSWATQGVLLLNRSLTTQEGKPKAHEKLWDTYTVNLVRVLSDIRPIAFILWGASAQQLKPVINKKSYIFTWSHPSPLNTSQDFADCPNFKEVNQLLERLGRNPINWSSIENTKVAVPKKSATKVAETIEQKMETQVEPQVDVRAEPQVETDAEEETDATEAEKMMATIKQKSACIIFTDGACTKNGTAQARGSYAMLIRFGGFQDKVIYERIDRRATNIVAEALGIKAAFDYLQANPTKWKVAYINTDSEFWVKMFKTYMPNWIKKGIVFQEKENPDLTIPLWKQYQDIKKTHTIIIRWVPAHNKKQWKNKPNDTYEGFCYHHNDYVDKMATYALNDINVLPGKKYIEDVEFE